MNEKLRFLYSELMALLCRVILILACGVVAWSLIALASWYPLIALVLLAGVVWQRLRRPPPSTAYGSARTAELPEIERAGLFSDHGLIFGRPLADRPSLPAAAATLFRPSVSPDVASRIFLAAVSGRGWTNGRLLRSSRFVHMASFSPTGGGKGVSVLKPNLLAYPGNCVVIDIGGDLFRETGEHRRKQFGHEIFWLDPFEICGMGSHKLNAFDFIDPRAKEFVQLCDDIADRLVIRPADEKDPHWSESAIKNITAFTSWICGCETNKARRNLVYVRKITASRTKYMQSIEVMQKMGDACGGVISRKGGDLTWHTGDELSSVMSTLGRHLNWLDDPIIARNISDSSFDPAILRTGRATIYLILPHESLSTMSRWLRLQIGTIMRRSTYGYDERNPVLWLLDEMANIGRMQVIEDAAPLLRAKGVRLWLIFQSLAQLKTCFGEKADVVLDNVGSQQYFAINSLATAKEISERCGSATVEISTGGDTTGDSYSTSNPSQGGGSRSRSRTVNYSHIARKLLLPEEVLTLPEDVTLIFHKNLPVITARLVKHYNAPEFRRRWFGLGSRGTAAPRRLGLAACILAACILVATVYATNFVLTAARPLPPRRWGGRAARMRDPNWEFNPSPFSSPAFDGEAWPVSSPPSPYGGFGVVD
jgi:type IV secretion system protein VirD4